jgi:hypothetical protein
LYFEKCANTSVCHRSGSSCPTRKFSGCPRSSSCSGIKVRIVFSTGRMMQGAW